MNLTKEKLQRFDFSRSLEWLETNGLGGYASSSVSGANTRRYHGLLVAALHPPVGRTVLVSKLDETIVVRNKMEKRYELGTNQFPGSLHPSGFQYLVNFNRDVFPVFHYYAGTVELKKTIAAVQGENTTLILYEVLQAPYPFTLELLPLYAARDFHSFSHVNNAINTQFYFNEGVLHLKNYSTLPEVCITVPGSSFLEDQHWYYNFEYPAEQERGEAFREDLYTHGKFSITLKKGSKLGVIISTEDRHERDAFQLFKKEKRRRETLIKNYDADRVKQLALAADQFIVRRGSNLKSIIAGYHWFSDWGRDTMIALPGICLVTKRFDDARKIIQAFANSVSEGMLPNRFPDYGEAPEYNTIDATLWFFYAIHKYYLYTQDLRFIKSLLPVLENIIDWHYNGTRYNIHVETDELLYGGQDGVQLTWMDAKVGDWVITPRKGKAVEVNALWYNALSIIGFLMLEAGNEMESNIYRMKARVVLESFNQLFWNEEQQCLYDYVDGSYKNDDLRPNQLYAISLPFPLLTKGKAEKVLKVVETQLLTPRGLRSLNASHKDYKPTYSGDIVLRDAAYHQGTVWGHLLGPYVDALLHVRGEEGKKEAKTIIDAFFTNLDEACVGSLSEIFDADPPHTARGCVAQAWSVAELLRVIAEYGLYSNAVVNEDRKAVDSLIR